MPNNNSNLKRNTESLQELLNIVNNLPEASNGVELPTLTNEGTATDLVSGKELIDGEGNVVTGTFTIDEELATQDDLITQIQTALEGKASSIPEGYHDVSEVTATAETVFTGSKFVDAEGNVVEGSVMLEEKTVTPTDTQQIITPTSGKVLSKVIVEAASGGGSNMIEITIINNASSSAVSYFDENAQVQYCPGYTTSTIQALNGVVVATLNCPVSSLTGSYCRYQFTYMFFESGGSLTTASSGAMD